MKKYVPGHVIDECRDLRRQGKTIEFLAGRIGGISPEVLAELLGEPIAKAIPVQADASEFDLWRSDELQAQL